MRRQLRKQLGSSLVEVLVAIALTGIMLPAFAEAVLTADAARPNATQRLQALSIEREATEAVRIAREANWNNVATNGTYHPVIAGNTWTLVSGSATTNGFTTQIVISDTQRNTSGAIVSSGGTVDTSTKHVVVTVSWTTPFNNAVSSETYLSRWQKNASWTQTTQTDFNGGTFSKTLSTNNSGGEVQLDPNAGTSWASPTQIGSLDISGTTNANGVYVDATTARAYVVNGAGLSVIDVSTPASPVLLGTFNAGVQINSVKVSGNYAYLASTSNTAGLTIVDVSNPAAPTQAATLDLPGTTNALTIYLNGNYAYIGRAFSATAGNAEFVVVDVSTPTVPTVVGSLDLNAAVNSIKVSGNYAYLATAVTTAELTVLDISNPASPASVGTFATTGAVAATNVAYDGTYVYLTEVANASGPEFFILNASNPASISQVGTYEMGGTINAVDVADNNAFLATAVTGQQFAVLDISNPASPTLEGSASQSTDNNLFFSNDIVYVASTSNTAELTVMGGMSTGTTWAIPNQSGSLNLSGTTAANDVAVDTSTNRAYVVNGTGLSIINISNLAAPTLLGTFNAGVQINSVYQVGNYAYLASTSGTAELVIVNVTNPAAPTQAGTLNLTGTTAANTITVSGSYAYIGKVLDTKSGDNEFFICNISNPAAPTLAGSFNLSGSVFSIKVSGNYAYLATAIGTAELTVINITNPAAPTQAGTFNTAGTAAGSGIFLANGYTYLTEQSNSGGAEMFILNASNPASISQVGAYEVGANVNNIAVSGNYAFLATAKTGQQFSVVDVTNPAAPVLYSSLSQSTNNNIAFANNVVYLASTNTTSEFIIVQPSTLTGAIHGTYESATFDAGSTVGFNALSFTVTAPSGTSFYFQIATNTNNATWNYVGPDGTNGTQYTSGGAIPINASSGRYLRFKAWLNTVDNTKSPIISDVTVNYSP